MQMLKLTCQVISFQIMCYGKGVLRLLRHKNKSLLSDNLFP